MSAPETVDVLVVGAGPAGLIAACALAAEGRSVRLVDPAPPATAPESDLRSTAFLAPSRVLLEAAGLWARLAPDATPLQVMRIVDAGGAAPVARRSADFDAAELGGTPFGWNLPNPAIRAAALARLAELPGARFTPGVALAGFSAREDVARVALSDGTRVTARLVVGADGRDSALRTALGIGARTWRFGQKALVFAVTHPRPHGNVSTEIHRSGGPFTLVPLPDRDGRPCSAVVWMERGAEAARLMALPDEAFAQAATDRSAGVLGRLAPITARQAWPIIARLADRFDGPRAVLIAEAAHVVPPIGAQGLNMSLADLAALVEAIRGAPDPGTAALLRPWAQARRADAALRVAGVIALNTAAMAEARPLRDLRGAALGLLHGLRPLRRAAMRAGLGMRG